MQTVFVNSEHCIGCRQCEFACAVEHSQSKSPTLAWWEEPTPKSRIFVEAGPRINTSFPNKCRHCNPAPCQAVCPTAAIARDADHDLVLVEPNKCIACAMCAMVCPFDAVTFHELAGVVPARLVATKCDGCVARVSRGDEPACAEACKVDALVFGELNDLVRAGRVHVSAVALSAVAAVQPIEPEAPSTVQAWRSWGEQATRVAEGVQHDHAPSH